MISSFLAQNRQGMEQDIAPVDMYSQGKFYGRIITLAFVALVLVAQVSIMYSNSGIGQAMLACAGCAK